MSYDHDSIIILTPEEIAPRFAFARIAELQRRYPHVHPDVIVRLITAAMTVNEPEASVVARYLEGNKSVQVSPEMYAAYAAIVIPNK